MRLLVAGRAEKRNRARVAYKSVIGGLGPSINLPIATSSQLGTGKSSTGPTGVALLQPGWGTVARPGG